MNRLILFVFVVVSAQLFAQINPEKISPVKVGHMNLQTGKVFYQNDITSAFNFQKLAEKLKSKEQVYSVFNINSVTQTEIKGTITNFQLNIDEFGVKRKKLEGFLIRPLNAIFNIEAISGSYQVTVRSMWFSNLPGDKNLANKSLESLVSSKNGAIFLNDKKNLRSITVIDKNFDELFKEAISVGF